MLDDSEISDTDKDGNIINNTINNSCSKCGMCCGMFIPFTDKEIAKIKKYVKKYNIKQVEDRETENGFEARCCFYDVKNKKCNIYSVRPYVCKDFICNRKDWKRQRNKYELIGDYNSTLKITKLASFDDLIYKDYRTLLRFIIGLVADENGQVDDKKFIKAIHHFHREDLLDIITLTTEDGKKVEGRDLE